MATIFPVDMNMTVPVVRVNRTDPMRAAQACNRDLEASFGNGAYAVVLMDESMSVATPALSKICAVAIATAAEPAVVSASVTGFTPTTEPAHYAGGYHWCRIEMRWKREHGYMWVGQDLLACQAACELPSLQFAIVSSTAWARVGQLEPALGAFADLDWVLRARKLGIQFRYVLTNSVKSIALPSTLPGAMTLEDIEMTLRLTRRHMPWWCWLVLVARRFGQCTALEVRKIQFHADFGLPIGGARRTYWYLRTLAAVFGRPALRREARALRQSLAPRCSTVRSR